MKRASLISWVDLLSFITFVLMIATGFLLEYILPPGSGRIDHGGLHKPITVVWGLTRHQWGDIHFWVAIALMACMAVHLWIHWKWILVSFKGDTPQGTRVRVLIGLAGLIGLLLVFAGILFGPKETVPRSKLLPDTSAESSR